MEDLEYWRNVLDGLDNMVVRILVQREIVSKNIGDIKRENNLSVHHPSREQEVVKRLAEFYSKLDGQHHDHLNYISRIYAPIFEQSRAIQYGISNKDCGEAKV